MYVLGFDIGGTKCAVTLGKSEIPEDVGELILDKLSFPTAVERGYASVIKQLLDSADALLERNAVGKGELLSCGISCGGPLDSKKGVIQCPPNLPDWDNVPITDIFGEHFGVPVYLQNDANACAVAEWKFGAGRGLENLVFLTFGTGMGAGLILDGRLYTGKNDLAGEVGHIRLSETGPLGYGKRGSFEGFCSGGGIERAAKEMLENHLAHGGESVLADEKDISAKTVAVAAKAGDEFARSVYRQCAKKLGEGLSILIDILNPEAIIIGSIYSRDRGLFDEIIADVIKREALEISGAECKILPALLGNSIGDYAALAVALNGKE